MLRHPLPLWVTCHYRISNNGYNVGREIAMWPSKIASTSGVRQPFRNTSRGYLILCVSAPPSPLSPPRHPRMTSEPPILASDLGGVLPVRYGRHALINIVACAAGGWECGVSNCVCWCSEGCVEVVSKRKDDIGETAPTPAEVFFFFFFVLIILYSLYLEYDSPLIPSASGLAG